MDSRSAPLYEIKAELFKALAHPVRIRALELMLDGETSVTTMLTDIGVSPSHLSGHLAVLRRHGVVTARREGSHVLYRIGHAAVPDLLRAARTFLADELASRKDQLDAAAALPALPEPVSPAGSPAASHPEDES